MSLSKNQNIYLAFRILVKTKNLYELEDEITQAEAREPRFRQFVAVNTDIAKLKEILISDPFKILNVNTLDITVSTPINFRKYKIKQFIDKIKYNTVAHA